MARPTELLEVKKRKNHFEDLLKPEEGTKRLKKPDIGKANVKSDVTSRLQAFLPDLKAANDSLPQDDSANIENVDDSKPYIEMDLGLGVLEEKHSDSEDEVDPVQRLLAGPAKKPSIEEISKQLPDSLLLCDPALIHYRFQCSRDKLPKLDIILSLMSRILIQLRRKYTNVDKITKLNVLQEDMYKLMQRRDNLISDQLVHETKYLEELDSLLSA